MSDRNPRVFVFVNLAIDAGYFGVHHGIAYLKPIVKKFGYHVELLQMDSDMSADAFRERIEALEPSIVGYSLTSLQVKYLARFSKAIESLPGVLQIAGGTGATLDPTMAGTAVDGFVVGEGEIPLEELLQVIEDGGDIRSTRGFVWHRDGKSVATVVPPFRSDISSLAFPDYTAFSREQVVYDNPAKLSVMISRGCPYNCFYCSNHALKRVYDSSRGYFRLPTVERSIEMIEHLLRQYPEVKFLNFEDDLLIARKEWYLEFAAAYKARIGLPHRLNVRTECITPEIVKALKESNCTAVFLGVESGNQEFRRTMLNRRHTNEAIIKASHMVMDAGIKLFTFNIVGFPRETKEQMLDTLRLNREIGPNTGVCTFFFPFPGTELFEISRLDGLLEGLNIEELPSNYNTRPIIPRTAKEKRDCIKVMNKMNAFFQWQNLKYNLREYRKDHGLPAVSLYFLRLLGFYGLQRIISHNNQLRIYNFVTKNSLLQPVFRVLMRGVR